MNWQLQRLVDEWIANERIIIGVDFDDTLKAFRLLDMTSHNRMMDTHTLLRNCIRVGARIVIHTAADPARYPLMLEYCESKGIAIEAINENLPGLKYGHGGKPYANIYLDDRAGIEEALSTLYAAMRIVAIERNARTE